MVGTFVRAGIKEGVKKKKILRLGKNETKLQKLKFKIENAPSKARISISGEGNLGEMVTPKKDLIEDYEILRNKMSRGKK